MPYTRLFLWLFGVLGVLSALLAKLLQVQLVSIMLAQVSRSLIVERLTFSALQSNHVVLAHRWLLINRCLDL